MEINRQEALHNFVPRTFLVYVVRVIRWHYVIENRLFIANILVKSFANKIKTQQNQIKIIIDEKKISSCEV